MLAYVDTEFSRPFFIFLYASRKIGTFKKSLGVTRGAVGRIRTYMSIHVSLQRQKFVLRKDHSALEWVLNFKDQERQAAHWIQQLQEYDL